MKKHMTTDEWLERISYAIEDIRDLLYEWDEYEEEDDKDKKKKKKK